MGLPYMVEILKNRASITASSSKSESAQQANTTTIAHDQVGGGSSQETNTTATPTRSNTSQQNEENSSRNNEGQINTLRVPPSGYGGAVPRRPISRDSSAESTTSSTGSNDNTKTCFCGHYTEVKPYVLYARMYALNT